MYYPLYIKKYRYVQAPICIFQNEFGPIHVRSQQRFLWCYCEVTELNMIVTSLLT